MAQGCIKSPTLEAHLGLQQVAEINGVSNRMLFKSKRSKQVRRQDLNKVQQLHNQCQQADLCKLSPFLQKDAKMPPSYPSRCGRRYVF